MKILHIPCLEDNYSYLIIDETSKEAAVVDPVEPEKVLQAAEENGVDLKLVLTTHHHWDHAGGNEKIKQLVPGIQIYGGSIDNVKGCTHKLENGDKFSLGMDINILSLHTPCLQQYVVVDDELMFSSMPSVISGYRGEFIDNSYSGRGNGGYGNEVRETEDFSTHLHNFSTYIHTKGHISYYITGKEEDDPAVFTGDTLFVAGCGRFFEGTAEQMYQSLCVTLGSLPKPTKVYCGHEYTVKNLQFALTVEPDNRKILQKLSWAQHQREANIPTIPSTIEEEMETNPFMRVDLPELQGRVGCPSPIEVLREIRRRKDEWRG